MPEFLEAALDYARRGWAVFPLRKESKKPLIGSNGFLDATKDEARIREAWAASPEANIGIATGAVSGISVIDIDPAKGGDASFAALVGDHDLSPTLASETGTGGTHLVFEHPADLRNSADKLADGVDVRGDGGYIVAPPSVHPNGNRYKWRDFSRPIIPMPEWLIPKHKDLSTLDLKSTAGTVLADSQTEERCKAYLQKIPDAISGSGGSGATLRAACECYRFGLSQSQAWNMMCWFNDHKCSPAWSEKELRHKLTDARKKVDAEGKFGMRIQGDNESAEWPIEFEGDSSLAVAVVGEPAVIAISEPVEPDTDPMEPELSPSVWTQDMLQPPGLIGDICQWINETAIKPQPILALANTLAFMGAVFGRKVRTPTDLRTNLYCLGVGSSGCGKDHSRKSIKVLCEEAGLTDELIGGEEVSSDSAIVAEVRERLTVLFQFDELGHFLANANSKYAATHQKNIAPTLMKLFSSASTKYIGKAYAEKERKDIDQPNVCIYGTTVPGRFYNAMTPDELTDGFLSRMLVFQSDNGDPQEQDAEHTLPPPDVVTKIQLWYGRTDLPRAKGNLEAMLKNVPITVPFNREAADALKAFKNTCRIRRGAAEKAGNGIDAIWGRAPEHAAKIALVLACGASNIVKLEQPEVSGQVCETAIAIVDAVTKAFVNSAREHISGSNHERNSQCVKRVIGKGPNGITHTQLIYKTRHLRPMERKEVLDQLIESTVVSVEFVDNTRGPKTKVYRVRKSSN